MRLRLRLTIVFVLAAGLIAGCGGDEEPAAERPTAVVAADLKKDGAYWTRLTPDLKDELIDLGKQQLGEDRPDGATGIQAFDTGKLVAEVDKQYANEAKRTETIYATYTGANDKLAQADLDDSFDQLEQLREQENP